MKIVAQTFEPEVKIVDFHGVQFTVPGGTQWLTASSYGRVVAWGEDKPRLLHAGMRKIPYWDNDREFDGWQTEVGKVDLEGMDWKQTLVTVE